MSQKSAARKIAAGALLATALSLGAISLMAQDGRKVVNAPTPPYPETAKQLHLTGVVKVQVVIAPDGHIKETNVVGGHPVLVSSVLETLKTWKYSPSSGETTRLLEFQFHP
jgi:TonB family protein